MRIWIELGRGSSSILSVAFFGISSVAISSDSIVLRFASLPDSYASNYNATSNPNCDLKIVKLTFVLRESRKKLEMEPQWEHDQARGGGRKGVGREAARPCMVWGGWKQVRELGVGGIKAMHGVEGGARPCMGWRQRPYQFLWVWAAKKYVAFGISMLMTSWTLWAGGYIRDIIPIKFDHKQYLFNRNAIW
jgi:hypothetical protein